MNALAALALSLAAMVQTCPPGMVCPQDTASPGWVWVTNQGRYGWGKIENGYFREDATPRPSPAPSQPNPRPTQTPEPVTPTTALFPNGVDIQALNAAPHMFSTNDPALKGEPGRQSPMPLEVPPANSFPVPLMIGAAMVAVSLLVGILSKKR
jgi:hypothetical protein